MPQLFDPYQVAAIQYGYLETTQSVTEKSLCLSMTQKLVFFLAPLLMLPTGIFCTVSKRMLGIPSALVDRAFGQGFSITLSSLSSRTGQNRSQTLCRLDRSRAAASRMHSPKTLPPHPSGQQPATVTSGWMLSDVLPLVLITTGISSVRVRQSYHRYNQQAHSGAYTSLFTLPGIPPTLVGE
jgi:hypothetical protein